MIHDRTIRMLELDLEYLHKTIDKFDNQRFTIRNWSVTVGGALLALAVGRKSFIIPLVGLLMVCLFAYLEIVYTNMQVRIQNRCTEVCSHLLRAVQDDPHAVSDQYKFGIREALGTEPLRWRQFPGLIHLIRPRPELYVFYLGLAVAMLVSAAIIWSIN